MTTSENKIRPLTNVTSLLADSDFVRVWGAGALIGVARWLETLAVGIFVFDLTGSAATVAVVASMQMLPMLLLGAVVGTLANRFSRRSLLLAGSAATGLTALILSLLALANVIAVWQIALGSFVTGVLRTSDFPVRRTLEADIAGQARTGTAMALEASAAHVTRLVGVAIGGLLVGAVGIDGAYLLGAVLYAATIFLLTGIRRRDVPTPNRYHNLWATTAGGLRILVTERYLMAVLAITIIFNFFGMAYISMVPVIGRAVLHANAVAVGLLSSTEAAASLVVSLLFAALAPRRRLGSIFVFSVLVLLVGVLTFALSRNYWFSLAVMCITGAAMGSFSVTQSTLMLLSSPPALTTRAMGVLVICIGLAPLGMLHLGWLAEHWSASTAVAISAVEGAVTMLAVMLLYPRILNPTLPSAGDTDVTGGGSSEPEPGQ